MTIDHAVSTIFTSPAAFTPALKILNGALQLVAVVRNTPVLPRVQQACDLVLDVFLCVRDLPNGIKSVVCHSFANPKSLLVSKIAFCSGTVLEVTLVLERWHLIRVSNSVLRVARARFLTPLFILGWSADLVDAIRVYKTSEQQYKEGLRIANNVLAIVSVVCVFAWPAASVIPMSFYVVRQICNCASAL